MVDKDNDKGLYHCRFIIPIDGTEPKKGDIVIAYFQEKERNALKG